MASDAADVLYSNPQEPIEKGRCDSDSGSRLRQAEWGGHGEDT